MVCSDTGFVFFGTFGLRQPSEFFGTGKRLGCYDFDSYHTICDGDIQFCEKPEALRKYILNKKHNEEGIIKEEIPNSNRLKA